VILVASEQDCAPTAERWLVRQKIGPLPPGEYVINVEAPGQRERRPLVIEPARGRPK
jgi:hypothetical protein